MIRLSRAAHVESTVEWRRPRPSPGSRDATAPHRPWARGWRWRRRRRGRDNQVDRKELTCSLVLTLTCRIRPIAAIQLLSRRTVKPINSRFINAIKSFFF